jgi:nitrogen fixation protein NifQ
MSDDPLAHAAHVAPAAEAAEAGAEPLSLPLDPQVAACMSKWLSVATDAACADTRLFAKLIAARDAHNELALLGLQPREWRALLARHFKHAAVPALPLAVSNSTNANEHTNFVHTLHTLLFTHTSAIVHADDAHCLATIIAHACLRPDHLWRDLGLAGRDEVTWMLTRYFPTLVALNVANLRWKKFLAAQRALSLGLEPGPAPGCPGCEDYGHCFPQHR